MSDDFDDIMARARARLAALDRAAADLATQEGKPGSDTDGDARRRRLLDDLIDELNC